MSKSSSSRRVGRRSFLASSSAAVLAGAVPVGRAARAAGSANERLALALIGCGGQGCHDMMAMLDAGGDGVTLAAVCDVDPRHMDMICDQVADRGMKPDRYEDFRGIIDRKDIDIVLVGTPDHWHAPPVLLACQAGKDVYVEKPLAHNIVEGRLMVAAARRYGRIVQVGQQQRSNPHFIEAMAYLRSGRPLGTILRTATYNLENESPDGIGNPPDSDPPPGVNYDRWLGPAPKRPFNPNRFHGRWRWFFDYAGGMMCDWNVHIQDLVHWGMGVDAPLSVYAVGGKRHLQDNRDTPDTMDVIYEYPGFIQVYQMCKWSRHGQYSHTYGTEFYGTDGLLFINRSGWEVRPEVKIEEIDDPDQPGSKKQATRPRTPEIRKQGSNTVLPHAANFLAAVRSRRPEDLNCEIEVGHRIATACHLGNIAMKLGRKIWWDRRREIIVTADGRPDEEANVHLGRTYRAGYELPEV